MSTLVENPEDRFSRDDAQKKKDSLSGENVMTAL